MKTKIFKTAIFSLISLSSLFSQKAGTLVMVVSSTNPTCNRYFDGSISITPSGGVAPYTYIWSTGDTTQSISNLLAGNYSVSVIDANNQTAAAFITLIDPVPVTIQATQINVTAYGLSNGSIDVIDVLNAVGSYTYTWSSQTGTGFNPSTLDQSNMPANGYKLIVTDENGCQGIQYFNITQPLPTLNPINLPKPGKVGNLTTAQAVYPNPSNGDITVDFKLDIDEYRIVNSNTGEVISSGNPEGERLNISNIPSGVYIIYSQKGNEIFTDRITVL
jgi:hypothetical protein